MTDIDKRVRNKSFKILKSKKIIVKKGLLKSRIESFYFPYFFNRKNKLPFVTGKIAISKNKLIHAYGPLKKTIKMPINKTIDRIYKTANLKVIGIRRIT